jgi:diguanylate cyclase (GGDEF)-like protein
MVRLLKEENINLKKMIEDLNKKLMGQGGVVGEEDQQAFLELKEQYEIVEALSRDYLNIFMVDVPNKRASIVKLDGYVTEGFGDKTKMYYPYEPFYRKYINDRVYEEDKAAMIEAMDLDKVKEMLTDSMEYVYSYRAVDKGEVHFYQFTYTKLTGENSKDKVIAGFKNIDTVVATAKEKEEFKHLSEIDIMTNVYNRGHGEKLAAEVVTSGECGMFCIFDMDDFKIINDAYGHNVGDKVLIEVAKRLNKTFRKGDVVFRLGGDEFAVAATGISDIELARSIIERFFSQVEKIKIPELKNAEISISAGCTLFENLSNKTFEEIYTDADSCVYLSKHKAGNVVEFYGYN